jgi:hypothetical protein
MMSTVRGLLYTVNLSHTSKYRMAVFSQPRDATACAAAAPIDASCSREGNAFKNDRQEEISFGKRNPETRSSTSLLMGPLGTLTTGRAQAMYSGILRVEKGMTPL